MFHTQNELVVSRSGIWTKFAEAEQRHSQVRSLFKPTTLSHHNIVYQSTLSLDSMEQCQNRIISVLRNDVLIADEKVRTARIEANRIATTYENEISEMVEDNQFL